MQYDFDTFLLVEIGPLASGCASERKGLMAPNNTLGMPVQPISLVVLRKSYSYQWHDRIVPADQD